MKSNYVDFVYRSRICWPPLFYLEQRHAVAVQRLLTGRHHLPNDGVHVLIRVADRLDDLEQRNVAAFGAHLLLVELRAPQNVARL